MLRGEGSDPSVERLLQGVAFLTGRIRRRLDDELPELSHGLMQLLWPHYLRPIPALVIQQFTAPPNETRALTIARGSQVRSRPVRAAEDAPLVPCVFQTLYDVSLPPLRVVEVRVDSRGRDDTLRLKLQLNGGQPLSALEQAPLSTLRFHLSGEGRLPAELLYFLLHRRPHGSAPVARAAGPEGAVISLPPVRAVGFDPEDALLPGWDRSLEGYRLLQEYYALPEKFLFVDVAGLERLHTLGEADAFWLEFPFEGHLPRDIPLRPEHFRLGCTPAVNLFPRPATPLRRRPHRDEYRVLAENNNYRQFEVFSVERVTGKTRGRGKPRTYRPFLERAVSQQGTGVGTSWYALRVRPDPTGHGVDTYLAFSLPEDPDRDERFTIELTCTNGRLPLELRAGDVCEAVSGVPAGVSLENLRAPTPSIPPPLGRGLEWRVIAHLALNRQSLASRDALCRLLTLYNFPATALDAARDTHFKRMDAIEEVTAGPDDQLMSLAALTGDPHRRGRAMLRGAAVTVRLSSRRFGGPGECFLLGSVLERFLAQWVSLNAFSRLTIQDTEGGAEPIGWPARLGRRQLI
jgi:type VI secretion system protein ImpG